MRLETCTKLVQEAACEDAVAAYVDAAGFLFKAVKEDNNCKANWHDRCGTKPHDDAEYEFKGVTDKSKEDEDLHNEWKYNHMISDELTRVAQLTEKNGMLEKDISASKPKLHESRGEEANADREKLQAERWKLRCTR